MRANEMTEGLIHEGTLRPRKVDLPADGLAIAGQRLVAKIDANGNVDLYWQRRDGTEANVTDVASMGGAPSNGAYLVTTAHAELTDEVVVGATPGGELGGSWTSPTVDTTHAGSSHAEAAKQEVYIPFGDVPDSGVTIFPTL